MFLNILMLCINYIPKKLYYLIYYQNPPDQNPYAFKIYLIFINFIYLSTFYLFFCIFEIHFLFTFYYHCYPYPRSVSGYRI